MRGFVGLSFESPVYYLKLGGSGFFLQRKARNAPKKFLYVFAGTN